MLTACRNLWLTSCMTNEQPAERETWAQLLAAEVRAACARKRITQVKLARAMGMSQPALSRRWVGELPFDTDQLFKIAKLIDVSVMDLLPSREVEEDCMNSVAMKFVAA